MFNTVIIGVLLANIVLTLIFWKRDQNVVYALVVFTIIFLSGATVFREYNQEWMGYQRTYYRLLSEKETDPAQKKKIRSLPLKIQQVWNEQLGVTDRCMTCHMGVNNQKMKDAEVPYKYHEQAREHDFEGIGCVICHQGQGRATTIAGAHSRHNKHWETPLLPLNLTESACNKCHKDQIEIKGGDSISKGKRLFVSMGCPGCHKVAGYEDYYNVATSLRRVAKKIEPSWLVWWLTDPLKYQPNAEMPNFRLSEEETVAITAYLMSQSNPAYQNKVKFDNGDSKRGKKLFREVGCFGCHKIGEEGSIYASDLSNIGRKISADWMLAWILNPKAYDPNTIMPNFRHSLQDAKDMTAYLINTVTDITLPDFKGDISSPELIKKGLGIIRTKGCSGCHEINGVPPSRIGPSLNKAGAKSSHDLNFGNAKGIDHTWAAWITHKLKDPSVYDTETIQSNMPTYKASDEDINSLAVFLKGMDGSVIPGNFTRSLITKEYEVEQGRKVIIKYNCLGCHVIGDKGGEIKDFYKGKFDSPPPLEAGTLHVGERVTDSWLYSFLRKPTPIRDWLKVVMPTYSFNQDEIYYLSRYFVNFSEPETMGEVDAVPADTLLIEGRKLILAFECEDCHDGSRGPKFGVMGERLQREWAIKWMKNTQEIYPGTKMPDHWPKKGDKHMVASRYSSAIEMMDGDPDRQIEAIWDYINNYNQKPFLDIKLAEDEDDDED